MTLFLLIFLLLLIAYGLLINFYRSAWNRMPVSDMQVVAGVTVSVVIAVRNEEQNIDSLLTCLYAQDYPRELFQIVVVDDHSTDATAVKIQAFGEQGQAATGDRGDRLSLVYVQLPDGSFSKKTAIAAGVHAATNELIVTTDGDCIMGPSWLSTVVSCYVRTKAKFIASPVLMEPGRSLTGIFQSLDFLSLQGITGASVYLRFHSMCNGANIAYPKAVFLEMNGFDGIDHIPSGDDMLLMHKVYTKYPNNVEYLKSTAAIVTTQAEPSWKKFLQQRIRWASKAVHYRDRRIYYVLLLTYCFNACFLILAVVCFFNSYWVMFLLLFLLAKVLIEFPYVNAVALFFNRSQLMRYFPFLQPIHIIYTIIAGWLGRFGSYTWKSRRIKNI